LLGDNAKWINMDLDEAIHTITIQQQRTMRGNIHHC